GLSNNTTYYVIDLTNGNYELASSLDDAEKGNAITLGSDPNTKDQTLTDNTNNDRAEATSGGSGGKIGVSVSLALNVVSDTTLASIGDSTALAAPHVTITGGGNVSVTATDNESTVGRALPASGGTSGTNVGVGASVGINVVNNT